MTKDISEECDTPNYIISVGREVAEDSPGHIIPISREVTEELSKDFDTSIIILLVTFFSWQGGG